MGRRRLTTRYPDYKRKEVQRPITGSFYTLIYSLRDLESPQQRFESAHEAMVAHELSCVLAGTRKMQPYLAILHMTGDR